MRWLVLLLLAGGCTGWVPMFWVDYGEGEGLGAEQAVHRDLGTQDLDNWSVGFAFAYGGNLPGLMNEPRQPTTGPTALERHLLEDEAHPKNDMDEVGIATAIGKWPWYTALFLFLAAAVVGGILLYRRRKVNAA